MNLSRKKLGNWGEQLAAEFLKRNNYVLLAQNYRCQYGEIDIIAREKDSIVFVEVKTRNSSNFGMGLEAVNYVKIQKIKKTAMAYLSEKPLKYNSLRFDVIDINLSNSSTPEIIHIKNAF